MSEERIAQRIIGWFDEGPYAERQHFLDTPPEKLTVFHFSLGMKVRNECDLWTQGWTPEIKNGVDVSPYHPDAISMRAIRRAHTLMREREGKEGADAHIVSAGTP